MTRPKRLTQVAILLAASVLINIGVALHLHIPTRAYHRTLKTLREGGILSTRPYLETRVDRTVAYYLKNTNAQILTQASEGEAAMPLPERLVIEPGIYRIGTERYDLSNEGLYRFITPRERNTQRIVYRHDTTALLSGLSWIVSHGNADNAESFVRLEEKAKSDKLYLTCGRVSRWANHLLDTLGIESRFVQTITLEEWNTYDNTHALIEVFRPEISKWVVYDLDNNASFTAADIETPLSLIELSDRSGNGTFTIVPLSHDIRLDVSNFKAKEFSYHFILEGINADIKSWYKRVLQVPLIPDGPDRFVHSMKEDTVRIATYSDVFTYAYLPREAIMNRFYAGSERQ